MPLSPSVYSPEVQSFLSGERKPTALAGLSALTLFPKARFPEEALAGLWLRLGDLSRSHEISQRLQTREAAFWHGIVHRREPDPSNAAYWFRRVGQHAVFPALRATAAQAAGYRQNSPHWDPFQWIEDWETARVQPADSALRAAADAVDRIEWEQLFAYCIAPSEAASER